MGTANSDDRCGRWPRVRCLDRADRDARAVARLLRDAWIALVAVPLGLASAAVRIGRASAGISAVWRGDAADDADRRGSLHAARRRLPPRAGTKTLMNCLGPASVSEAGPRSFRSLPILVRPRSVHGAATPARLPLHPLNPFPPFVVGARRNGPTVLPDDVDHRPAHGPKQD